MVFFMLGKADSVLTNENTIATGMICPYKKDMKKGVDFRCLENGVDARTSFYVAHL